MARKPLNLAMNVGNLSLNGFLREAVAMANFPTTSNVRAPRMRIPNSQTVTIALDGGRLTAVALKLSSTGGLLGLRAPMKSGSLAELQMDVSTGKVNALVEVLQPQKSGTAFVQAFRFIALEDDDHHALKHTLSDLARKGLRES